MNRTMAWCDLNREDNGRARVSLVTVERARLAALQITDVRADGTFGPAASRGSSTTPIAKSNLAFGNRGAPRFQSLGLPTMLAMYRRAMPSSNTLYAAFLERHQLWDQTVGFGVLGEQAYGRLGVESPSGKWHELGGVEGLAWLGRLYERVANSGWAERDAGQYHPRFFTGSFTNTVDATIRAWGDAEAKEAMRAEEQVDILDSDLVGITRVVAPGSKTKDTYGSKIRNTLMVACTEVESQCKGILKSNGYAFPERPSTGDYVRLCKSMRLDEYSVRLQRHRDYPEIRPFKGWTPSTGVAGVGPTTSLPWYHAYNEAKHDRELNFELATLEHALSAVAGLHVLLIAQYGPTTHRQLTRDSFFIMDDRPVWHHKDRTYPPLPGAPWVPVPYKF